MSSNWLRVFSNAEVSQMAQGVRQLLHTREVLSDKCVELRCGALDVHGRCCSVFGPCAPCAMASFVACCLKLLHPFFTNYYDSLVVRLHVFDRFQNQVQPFDFHVSVGQTCQNKVVAPLGGISYVEVDRLA